MDEELFDRENIICDCGHRESPHSEITRGYATDNDGKTFCYDCTFEGELKTAQETGKLFAYLSSDGREVTNWVGRVFSDEIRILSESTDNFGGERINLRFKLGGDIYSGFAMGRGVYLRAKRTKLQNLYAA